jgi:hypothetical protein
MLPYHGVLVTGGIGIGLELAVGTTGVADSSKGTEAGVISGAGTGTEGATGSTVDVEVVTDGTIGDGVEVEGVDVLGSSEITGVVVEINGIVVVANTAVGEFGIWLLGFICKLAIDI